MHSPCDMLLIAALSREFCSRSPSSDCWINRRRSSANRLAWSARRWSSARLRSTTLPSWVPICDISRNRAWSTSNVLCVKNSNTATTSLPTRTGKANADLSPAELASRKRKKLPSLVRSAIHAGAPVANTRPGSPTPGWKHNISVWVLNDCSWSASQPCQMRLDVNGDPDRSQT